MHRIVTSTAIVALLAGAVGTGLLAAYGPIASVFAQQAQSGGSPTWAPGGKRERWTADNCAFAFIDHQTGLMNVVDNARPVEFKNMVIALAKTAKIHNVPSVITTSAEDGPNGPFLPEVLKLLPKAPVISRPGQINAWDNSDFVEAIRKTGRRKIVMSGITTDVCVTFAALSALDAGYEVYVVVDASGSMNTDTQNASLMRMADAGARAFLVGESLMREADVADIGVEEMEVRQVGEFRHGSHSRVGDVSAAAKIERFKFF